MNASPPGEQRQVNYLALGGDYDHYGMLSEAALAHANRLRQHLAAAWNAGEAQHGFAGAAAGCLAKLSSTLLQTKRLSVHHSGLLDLGEQNRHALTTRPDASLSFGGAEACTDFENLLLQGRATLDRLTYFLDFQLFPNQAHRCDRFSRLPSQIGQAERVDPRGAEIATLLANIPWLCDFLAEIDGRSLRSYVAHRLAAVEWLDSCFAIVALDVDHVVVFDAVVNGHPVFDTALRLAQETTYFTLNSLAVFTIHESLSLESCLPRWSNKALVFSDWLSEAPTSVWRLIARRMTPGGFDVRHAHLREEIRGRAIDFTGK